MDTLASLEEPSKVRRAFNRDTFHSIASRAAASACVAALSAVQERTPEEQVAGLAAAFLLIAERVGMQPQDVFSAVSQMMNHHETNGERTFDGARFYLDADVFAG